MICQAICVKINMRLFFLIFIFLINELNAGRIIQLKDFLCGCDYCRTVSTSEPLDIGRHMIMCHSWRDATMKTIDIMEQMKKEKEIQDKYGIPVEDTLPSYSVPDKNKELKVEEPFSEEVKTIYNDYEWRESDEYGWEFSATSQYVHNEEGWIYLEELEWVWKFGENKNFLYSLDCGWLYRSKYRNYKILYWYDRRIWVLLKDFKY